MQKYGGKELICLLLILIIFLTPAANNDLEVRCQEKKRSNNFNIQQQHAD